MSDDATMEEPPAAVSAPADSIVIRAPQKAERVTEPLSVSDDIQERFQGATVAALGLLPPATVAPGASVRVALAAARAHRGQCVLVVDGERLRGFADMVDLLAAEAQGGSDEAVSTVQQPFAGTPEAPAYPTSFRILTHATPLAEVAMFFDEHAFALLTDDAGERIVGVVTRGDLERYAEAVGLDVSAGVLGSRSEEESRRDQTLAELLRLLDGSSTLIPDEVSSYYLERAGFRCEDVRLYVYLLARLLALATEKFVADIAADAFQYARIRTNAGPGRSARTGPAGRVRIAEENLTQDRARTVLTMDDLSAALGEYGIDARRAESFR